VISTEEARTPPAGEGVWTWVDRIEGDLAVVEDGAPDELPIAESVASTEDLAEVVGEAPLYDIPVDMTPEVAKWIEYFTGSGRKHYARWLKRAPLYRPMMQAGLAEAGLPQDLVYLSMIESGYNTHAYSHAAAAGLWQFIAPTGRAYGLRIDWWVDERRDPELALGAAIAYLDELHGRFDDWRLAWASYNTGPGRVRRAVERSGSRDFWDLARGNYLHSETDNYVPKIMAAAIVGKNLETYGFEAPSGVAPLSYDVARVEGSVDVEVLAECAKMELEVFKKLNPALRRFATPPEGYDIRVPSGGRDTFVAALAKVPKSKLLRVVHHTVGRGETLSVIGSKYGVSVDAIARANSIRNPDRVRVGTRLAIPKHGASGPPATRSASSATPSNYTVKSGDTLSGISGRYGVDVAEIRRRNQLKGNTILVGQKLNLTGTAAAVTGTRAYTVRRGDTLGRIASRHGMSASSLQKLNAIGDPSKIYVGQRLKVQGSASSWKTYKVRSGDSLGQIATKSGCSVDELVQWNELGGTVIHPGQVLRVGRG
jgi:membrane-bound lytic murein transglycosylase D